MSRFKRVKTLLSPCEAMHAPTKKPTFTLKFPQTSCLYTNARTVVVKVELGLLAAQLDGGAVKLARGLVLVCEAAQVQVLAAAVDGRLPALVLFVPAHTPVSGGEGGGCVMDSWGRGRGLNGRP